MIILQHSNKEDYDLSRYRYRNSQIPFLIILTTAEELVCHYNEKNGSYGWNVYITEKLKWLLRQEGLSPIIETSPEILYLYGKQITSFVSFTNPSKTECILEIKLLKDYGLTVEELINFVVKETKNYLTERRL